MAAAVRLDRTNIAKLLSESDFADGDRDHWF
jgi:hypothetical protein